MNKAFFMAIATMCLASMSIAQMSDERLQLQQWLQKYYCQQNNVEWLSSDDPRYSEMKQKGEGIFSLPPLTLEQDMYAKIKLEFPMDPGLQSAITVLQNQKTANYLALAQRYGYSSYDELWKNIKTDPKLQNVNIFSETQKIDNEYSASYFNITSTYNTEFNKRYEAAVIEAIKRIQENANAMNAGTQK